MIADRIRFGGILDDVGAAETELRHLAAYLAWVSAADGDALSRAEHRLANAAERIGGQLAALAGEPGRGLLGSGGGISKRTTTASSWRDKIPPMSTTTLIVVIIVLVLLFGGGGGYYWRRRR